MERDLISVGVQQLPNQKFEYPEPRQSSLPICFHISYKVKHREIYRSDDGSDILTGGLNSVPVAMAFWSDSELMAHDLSAYSQFSPKLALFGIEARYHQALITDIIQDVRKIAFWVSEKRAFLPLRIEILREHQILYNEGFLMEIAMRLSRQEFERNNNSMVPTARKALRLKCVKMESENGNCTICLEELEEFAAAMPCKHIFHGQCIKKWFEASHYCPICRFEMPTIFSCIFQLCI